MLNLRSQLDKIIITAMDRFVWFVLLVVMSHLVTEFTRVTGYARGNRHEVVLINDSLVQPMPVANMIFYPGQDYGLYDQTNSASNHNNNNYYYNANSNSNSNGINNYNNNNNAHQNSAVMNGPANGQTVTGLSFSFRPLIDSIFEIPISTLRAVNNLVARLTGSYQHQAAPGGPGVLKSAAGDVDVNANTVSGVALPAFHSLNAATANVRSAPMLLTADNGRSATQDAGSSSSSDNRDGNNGSSGGGGSGSDGSNKVFVLRKSTLREVNT